MVLKGNLLVTPPPNQYLIKEHNYLETKLIERLIGKRFAAMLFATLQKRLFDEINSREIYFVIEPGI